MQYSASMIACKKHFGQSASIRTLSDGDLVPIGGRHIHADAMDVCVKADLSVLESHFVTAVNTGIKLTSEANIPKVATWLNACNIKAEPKLWAQLYNFQKNLLEATFPNISAQAQVKRRKMYAGENPILLSEVIAKQSAECSEISILAKNYLDKLGVPNELFIGAHASEHSEFSSPHAFIIIPNKNGGADIWDPSNPIQSDQGAMPSLYNMDKETYTKWISDRDKGSSYVALPNVITSNIALYGVTDGCNICPEQVIHPKIPN